MTPKNPVSDNTEHISAFLATLSPSEAHETFLQIRDRFNFHGSIFTDTDVHEQVVRQIETNWEVEDDEIVDAVASNVTDALAASPDFRVIMEDKMEEAGRDVLDTAVEDLMRTLDRRAPVVLLEGAWGSLPMRVGGFADLSDAYTFARNAIGRPAEEVRAEATGRIPLRKVLTPGGFPQETITAVALEVDFTQGDARTMRIPLSPEARTA